MKWKRFFFTMKHCTSFLLLLAATLACGTLRAQVPLLVNYQGRVAVGAVNFEGAGQFKFALVNSDGTTTFWSNDGTSVDGSEPASAVTLSVEKGLYSVLLGDIKLGNMTAIPSAVFANGDVRLRVWFDDGANGSQLLAPDQRLAPAAYLADAAVTTSSIANGAVTGANIAAGSITARTSSRARWISLISPCPLRPTPGRCSVSTGIRLTGSPPTPGGIWSSVLTERTLTIMAVTSE